MTGWVVVKTAARMLGVSRQRIWQLIHAKRLKAKPLDGSRLWVVSVASVEKRKTGA